MSARARIAWAWVWVVVCIGVIWTLSGEGFSGGSTSHMLSPLLRWLFPDFGPHDLFELHYWVRKSAHLVEYAVLAMLSFRALRLSLHLPMTRVMVLALLIVVAVAGIDELRQSFLPARTGALSDVVLNFVGGSLGVIFVVAVHRWLGIGAPAPKEGA
ncbi:MAG: VanZ family protein [Myxococcota bacterium]|nr:VanZ family protein [Myxococcota bacterium]